MAEVTLLTMEDPCDTRLEMTEDAPATGLPAGMGVAVAPPPLLLLLLLLCVLLEEEEEEELGGIADPAAAVVVGADVVRSMLLPAGTD